MAHFLYPLTDKGKHDKRAKEVNEMPKYRDENGLTKGMRRFVTAYIANGYENATKAAIEAGYSPKTAHVKGSQLLADEAVKSALAKAQASREQAIRQRMRARADRAINLLQAIIDDETAAPRDRINAANSLLDRCGYKATERIEASVGGGGAPIKVELQGLLKEWAE